MTDTIPKAGITPKLQRSGNRVLRMIGKGSKNRTGTSLAGEVVLSYRADPVKEAK